MNAAPSRPVESDILIIGAGPAGTSAATLLADYGHRVIVLEREKFPRYHIGESLIPFCYGPLERLGMIPRLRASAFVKKYSVCFVQPDGRASQPFYFFNRYDRESIAQSWQVLRSEFDQMMVGRAREAGADVREEVHVRDFLRDHHGRVIGVTATDRDGGRQEFRARLTIDATGKEALASSLLGWRHKDPYLNKIAIWTYYEGSTRGTGIDEGQTTVAFVPHKGWFWHIPLHNDRVSVGVVAEGKYLTRDGVKDPRAIFEREIGENAWIKERLSTGRCMGQYWVTSEYSRHSRHCAAPGLLLVGDAFAFLDPVFSSGVMLALKSGVHAADAVHEALVDNDLSPARFADYGAQIRQGVENMRKLVYSFYKPNFGFKDVIDRHPEAAGLITDCLSGDVNKDFSQLWSWFEELVELPDELPYGTPLTEKEAGRAPEPVLA
ncbi:MAG: NAD(P)/FAD-dependent oxidoreductase [Verrucomicrobiales bacterium]